MRRLVRALAATAVAVAVSAPAAAASAGAPITLSTDGANPYVAVDSAGTADIVWDGIGADSGSMEYCQIPLGATACTNRQSFTAPDESNARVLLGPSPGEVVLVDQADGMNTSVADVWVSMDGGTTFTAGPNGAAGVEGGDFPTRGGTDADRFSDNQLPVFGPGGFSVSWMDGAGYFENFPDNSGAPAAVGSTSPVGSTGATGDPTVPDTQLFTDCGYPAPNSIALLNNATPVAECLDSPSGTIHYRVATGAGDLNDVSTGSWGPDQSVPGGTNALGAFLAGGSRGVYLLSEGTDGSAQVRQLVNGTFGAPITIAPHTFVEGLSEDANGNLFAITQDTTQGDPGIQQRVFTSGDGVTWTEVPLNLTGVDAGSGNAVAQVAGCDAATGGSDTGSGWATFNSVGSATAGTIYAEEFGSSPCGPYQGSSTCPTSLTVGAAVLTARTGCFTAGPNGTYSSSGEIEMNGVMITPGATVSADRVVRARDAGTAQVVIDTVNRTLSSGGAPAVVGEPQLPLGDKPLDWLLPGSGGGTITDLANAGEPVSFTPSAIGTTLKGFAINGLVTPALQAGGETSLPMNVQVPSPIGGFIGSEAPTDDLTLLASNAIPGGLAIGPGDISISLPTVSLGIATLDPFTINYDADPNTFDGTVGIHLPVISSDLNAHFQFADGQFVEGDLTADLGNTVPLDSDVFLTQVGIKVYGKHGGCPVADWVPGDVGANPTYIGGNVNVGIGPIGPDDVTGLFNVDGNMSYTFPETSCNEPGVFQINGDAEVFGFSVASGFIRYSTDGDLSLGAGIDIGPSFANISGNIGGELATDPVRYDMYGDLSASLFGLDVLRADVIASSVGIDGCLEVFGVNIGTVGYVWGGSVHGSLFTGCDVDDYVPAGLSLPPGFDRDERALTSTSYGVTVPEGVPTEGIGLIGTGGAPLVTLTGPKGQTVTVPTPSSAGATATANTLTATVLAVAQDPEAGAGDGLTEIKLKDPQAGKWTITPLPGSPAITKVLTAKGLPAIAIKAHVVKGPGHAELLDYTNVPAPGRVVTFMERQATGAMDTLGTAKGKSGKLRFLPGAGPAGRRQIVAEVTERGLSAAQLTVATYAAPGPAKLAAPKPVTVTRVGTKIRISWHRVPGAARYVVRPILKDGRALVLLEPQSASSTTVTAVPGFDSGAVMVAALDAANRPGAIAQVGLKALKPACSKPRAVKGKLVCAKTPKPKSAHHKHSGGRATPTPGAHTKQ